MSWNYRVIDISQGFDDECYGLFEVYYNDEGIPTSHGSIAVAISDEPKFEDFIRQVQAAVLLPIHDPNNPQFLARSK